MCPSTMICMPSSGVVVIYTTNTVKIGGATWYVYLLYAFKPQYSHPEPSLAGIGIAAQMFMYCCRVSSGIEPTDVGSIVQQCCVDCSKT